MELVLLHPEIPHNSGCAGRLAAATGLPLHMVEPLGFSLEDRYLKRAGLDYWPMVNLQVHADWACAVGVLQSGSERALGERLRLFSARGGGSLFETDFHADDILCFGSETQGLPEELLAAHPGARVYIPIQSGVRSLNLANVVCLAAYTAMVSAGLPLPSNDGAYAAPAESGRGVRPSDIVNPRP